MLVLHFMVTSIGAGSIDSVNWAGTLHTKRGGGLVINAQQCGDIAARTTEMRRKYKFLNMRNIRVLKNSIVDDGS